MSQVVEVPNSIPVEPASPPSARTTGFARAGAVATHPALIVTLLTLLGGAIRFWRLNEPALWGDEVQTYRRVCGSFQDLVDQLAAGGFTPLHYLLYFWIGKHTTLTPTMMRLPVAIFGTLLVPAMYFLARQIVRPPVAILAAAITACNAYQLSFSRDAKMYSDLWLCGTVHMACFFWFLRSRSAIAWWGWVAAGAAMMGVQFVGAALLPIELVILLSSPGNYWRSLWPMTRYLAWLPAALIAMPFRAWRFARERSLARDAQSAFAVLPIATPSCDTTGSAAATAHAPPRLAWARHAWLGLLRSGREFSVFHARMADFYWPGIVLFVLGVALAGAAPYAYYAKFNPFFGKVYDADHESFNWTRTGIGWVSGYNAGRDGLDLIRYTATAFGLGWEWPRTPQWNAIHERTARLLIGASVGLLCLAIVGALPLTRRLAWRRRRSILWIALWMTLPAYAFYCASTADADSPLDWIARLLLKHPPDVPWPKLPMGVNWRITLYGWMHDGALRPYFASFHAALHVLASGFSRGNLNLWSIGVFAVAVLAWTAAALRMNRRSLWVASQTVLTIVGILLLCFVLRIAIGEPFPRSVWVPRYLGFIWPAFAIALAVLFWRLPTRPIRWAGIALLLIVNLAQGGARVLAGSEPPTELMARDILDSQPPLHSRLFSSIPAQSGSEPGTGVLESAPARYYLAVYSGKPITPTDFRSGAYENQFLIGRPHLLQPLTLQVKNTINDKSIDQIIVWDELRPNQIDLTDPIAAALPDRWRRVSESRFAARDHWTWTDYFSYRRRVYQKADG